MLTQGGVLSQHDPGKREFNRQMDAHPEYQPFEYDHEVLVIAPTIKDVCRSVPRSLKYGAAPPRSRCRRCVRARRARQSSKYIPRLDVAKASELRHRQQGLHYAKPRSRNSAAPPKSSSSIVFHGWDINGATLDKAMERACVYEYGLQEKLRPYLSQVKQMKSIYYPDLIAANQSDRADNILKSDRASEAHLAALRADIARFRKQNALDKVIVVWTVNTERFSDRLGGVYDT